MHSLEKTDTGLRSVLCAQPSRLSSGGNGSAHRAATSGGDAPRQDLVDAAGIEIDDLEAPAGGGGDLADRRDAAQFGHQEAAKGFELAFLLARPT